MNYIQGTTVSTVDGSANLLIASVINKAYHCYQLHGPTIFYPTWFCNSQTIRRRTCWGSSV